MLFLDGPGRQYLPRQPVTLQSQHNFLKIFPSHDEILNIFSMTFEEKIIISDNIKQQKKLSMKTIELFISGGKLEREMSWAWME